MNWPTKITTRTSEATCDMFFLETNTVAEMAAALVLSGEPQRELHQNNSLIMKLDVKRTVRNGTETVSAALRKRCRDTPEWVFSNAGTRNKSRYIWRPSPSVSNWVLHDLDFLHPVFLD